MGVSREKEGERGKRKEKVGLKRGRIAGWMGEGWGMFDGEGLEKCWEILPISMWKKKGCDRRGNPVMINMVT